MDLAKAQRIALLKITCEKENLENSVSNSSVSNSSVSNSRGDTYTVIHQVKHNTNEKARDLVADLSNALEKMGRIKPLNSLNKSGLVRAITSQKKMKLSDTEKLVNAFIETVSEELKSKGKVTLVGFGTFAVAHRKAKTGVNPKTGAKITIKSKDVPVFKPGKALKGVVK